MPFSIEKGDYTIAAIDISEFAAKYYIYCFSGVTLSPYNYY